MRAFISKAYAAVKAGLLAYPGGTAAVLGIVCAIVARFGLHVTVNELTAVAAVVAAVAGTFVHRTTVAKAKLEKNPGPQPAGARAVTSPGARRP
jgi:hypothetical protein